MATQPEIPQPDTIEPQSPAEVPATPTPDEHPAGEPPEITPTGPDIIEPGSPPETPPPPD